MHSSVGQLWYNGNHQQELEPPLVPQMVLFYQRCKTSADDIILSSWLRFLMTCVSVCVQF